MAGDFKWYIVHTYSGSENRVVQLIKEHAARKDCEDAFEELIVPTEEIVELKNGEMVSSNRKYLPGYVLAKMRLTDQTLNIVKNVPRVSGFLGDKGRPIPVSEIEVERILKQIQESAEAPRNVVTFNVGDQIKVIDGPFASFNGFVEEIEEDKQKLKISVMVFGRPTPISLDYLQVEKA
ncbi:MAG: transcription termination/antitermination protein NusG [Holosporales bacterium]|jgi:transcriptional antiterminator NusG|nr:transcription termination/antitermination protein NusG [Holosporales bacterium]